MTRSASSPRGANCATTSAASAPTAWSRRTISTTNTPSAAKRCAPNGGAAWCGRFPRMSEQPSNQTDASSCQSCGACCAYSSNWPRFTIEEDAALDLIPAELVNERLSGMRCEDDRCCALDGEIAQAVTCRIYAIRPEVCRTC